MDTDEVNADDHENVTKRLGHNNNDVTFDQLPITSSNGSLSKKRNICQQKPKINTFTEKMDSIISDSSTSESSSSLDVLPTQNNSAIIEECVLANKRLTKRGISNMNIVKDDGTIITGYAMAYPKRNRDFHNFFKEISPNEYLINDYSCALHKDILTHGKIFVSLHYVGFHSNIFGWVNNVVIPLSDVTAIEKKMTAFVVPNAIQVTTKNTKYLFSSFLSRDSVYEILMKLWDHSILNKLKGANYAFDVETNEKECEGPKSEDSGTTCTSTITLQGEDNKVHHETICDCSKNNEHFDKVILDTKFKGSVEKIYNLLYTSGFTAKFLEKRNDDVNIGEWTKDDDGKLVRMTNYTKQFNKIIVPTVTKCYIKDEVLYQDFEKYVTVMATIETPDLPSGGVMVKIRTCIMWADSRTTRVIITFTVEFSEHSSLKSTIEKELLEGQLEFYKELEKTVRKYISHHLSEFDYETASTTLLFNDKNEEDDKHVDDSHHPIIKRNFAINTTDKDLLNHKLRIWIPDIKTLVLIALLLTSIANMYILTSLRNINAKIEFIEGEKGADNLYKGIIVEFDQICSLNKWLNELKKIQLFSISDENLWDTNEKDMYVA